MSDIGKDSHVAVATADDNHAQLDLVSIMPQIRKDFEELNDYIKGDIKKYAKGEFPIAKDAESPPHWIRKEGENFRTGSVFGQELDELPNRPNITPGAKRMAEFLSRNESLIAGMYQPRMLRLDSETLV